MFRRFLVYLADRFCVSPVGSWYVWLVSVCFIGSWYVSSVGFGYVWLVLGYVSSALGMFRLSVLGMFGWFLVMFHRLLVCFVCRFWVCLVGSWLCFIGSWYVSSVGFGYVWLVLGYVSSALGMFRLSVLGMFGWFLVMFHRLLVCFVCRFWVCLVGSWLCFIGSWYVSSVGFGYVWLVLGYVSSAHGIFRRFLACFASRFLLYFAAFQQGSCRLLKKGKVWEKKEKKKEEEKVTFRRAWKFGDGLGKCGNFVVALMVTRYEEGKFGERKILGGQTMDDNKQIALEPLSGLIQIDVSQKVFIL